jgi:hypothetical protein
MRSLIPLARPTELVPRSGGPLVTSPHQLSLVLDDMRLVGMTQEERRAALRALAHLLLEAGGASWEAGDDIE